MSNEQWLDGLAMQLTAGSSGEKPNERVDLACPLDP